jgi:hypothetical protein
MTRNELIAYFVKQRAEKISLTWSQFAGVISALDDAQKNTLLGYANSGNGADLAKMVNTLVRAKKTALAQAELDAIAIDDTATFTELAALL